MATDEQGDTGLRVKLLRMAPCSPLPYIPPVFPGETLSSWLRRIAVEYGVSLRHLIGHFGLLVSRVWDIDHALSADDVHRLALALRTGATEIRSMIYPARTQLLHRSSVPLHVCSLCRVGHQATTYLPVTIRAWFEWWQIECQHCQTPFSPPGPVNLSRCNPAREEPAWFESLRPAARMGSRLLVDFACRPFSIGLSPLKVLRLLSMRFDAARFANKASDDGAFASRRLVELFVPGLSELGSDNLLPEPWTEKRPVHLVTARTILLAGLGVVLRNPPQAIDLLQSAAAHVWNRDFDALLRGMKAETGLQSCLY